jgi:hypothetical protein
MDSGGGGFFSRKDTSMSETFKQLATQIALEKLRSEKDRREDLLSLVAAVDSLTDELIAQMALLSALSEDLSVLSEANPMFAGACIRVALGSVMRERMARRQRENN